MGATLWDNCSSFAKKLNEQVSGTVHRILSSKRLASDSIPRKSQPTIAEMDVSTFSFSTDVATSLWRTLLKDKLLLEVTVLQKTRDNKRTFSDDLIEMVIKELEVKT